MPIETPTDPIGDQLADLNTKLQADAKKYGVTPEELTQLAALATEYVAKRTEKRDKQREAQAATVSFATTAKQAKTFNSLLRRRMNLHPDMTSEARQLYQMPERNPNRTVTPVPNVAPFILLDTSIKGRTTINAGTNPGNLQRNTKPKGAVGLLVEHHENAAPANEAQWQHLKQVSSSPVTHKPEGSTRTFAYRACYVDKQGNRSPWSDVVVGTVG